MMSSVSKDRASSFSAIADVRRHWAVYLGLVIALAIWCAVDVARRAVVDPQHPSRHMTDFTVYTEAGAAFFDGREPYEVSNIRGWKYLYPPLFALLVSPLSALSTPWQATVWFALSALMAFGCYFECRRFVAAFVGRPISDTHLSFGESNDARPPIPGPSAARGEGGTSNGGRAATRHPGCEVTGAAPPAVPLWLFFTALAAAIFPAFNCLQRGQMGLALVYPLLLGFRWMWLGESSRTRFAGAFLLALPVALKLTPALPALIALAIPLVKKFGVRSAECGVDEVELRTPHSELRTSSPFRNPKSEIRNLLAFSLGLLTFFLLLPAALVGWNANLRHLHTWYVRVASRVDDVRADDFGGDVASFRNQSLHNAVYRCGNWIAHTFFGGPDDVKMDVTAGTMPMDAPIVGRLLTAARVAALTILAVILVLAGRGRDGLLQGAAFGLAGVATLVVSPVARGHYYVFWIPAVMFVPLWLHSIGRPRAAFVLALVPAILTLLHYALLPYAGRVGLLGLGTSVWYFATCGEVWLHRRAVRASGSSLPAECRGRFLARSAA